LALAPFALGCNLFVVVPTRWERGVDRCPPGSAADEWPTASPSEAGLSVGPLDEISARAARGDLGNLHSILVVRDGRLVFERYFAGPDQIWGRSAGVVTFDASTLHDLRSVSKSIVGALIGIALGAGMLPGLDASLLDLLPTYRDRVSPDVQRIQLRHALLMSAGLAWDELSMPYWWPWNDETEMWRSDDPVGFVLTRAVVAEPGSTFAYNGGLPTVLGAIVEQASGTTLDRFAANRLFCPLGISAFEWMRHPSGTYIAASGLRLRPRDIARFGWMMLEGGRFGGRQIVPEDYVRASLFRQEETKSIIAPGYGYQWWVTEVGEADARRDVPAAIGYGGQRIFLLAKERIVVVVTAGMYDSTKQREVPQRVLEAVLAATTL
jgi:CubicO group peptidase (beta-lactamase class C family)